MIKSNKSIRRRFFWGLLSISVAVLLLTNILWFYSEYRQFKRNIEEATERTTNQQKALIKREVKRTIDYISYMRETRKNDSVEDLKKKILDCIARIRFGTDGYIFVVTYDGTTLMNDTQRELIGKNIWNLEDPNGVKVIQEERKAVENPDGDFIYYVWNKPTEKTPSPKITFMKGVPDWEWMIGAGTYLKDIKCIIDANKALLKKDLKSQIIEIFTLFLAILAMVIIITINLSKRIRSEFDDFGAFLDNGILKYQQSDNKQFVLKEFQILADYTNKILKERQRMEAALKESEEKYRLMVESSGDGIVISQKDKFIFVNDAFAKMLGYDKDDLVYRNYKEVYTETAVNKLKEREKQRNKGQKVSNRYETVFKKKDGTEIDVEAHVAIIEYKGAKVTFAVIRDITKQKEIIKKLQKSAEQTGDLKGFISICAGCNKIRDDEKKGKPWVSPPEYMDKRFPGVHFSHGMCPDCMVKWYPDHVNMKDIGKSDKDGDQ